MHISYIQFISRAFSANTRSENKSLLVMIDSVFDPSARKKDWILDMKSSGFKIYIHQSSIRTFHRSITLPCREEERKIEKWNRRGAFDSERRRETICTFNPPFGPFKTVRSAAKEPQIRFLSVVFDIRWPSMEAFRWLSRGFAWYTVLNGDFCAFYHAAVM